MRNPFGEKDNLFAIIWWFYPGSIVESRIDVVAFNH